MAIFAMEGETLLTRSIDDARLELGGKPPEAGLTSAPATSGWLEETKVLSPALPPYLTVVVPMRNEAANVTATVARLASSMGTTPVEVVSVNDSTDGTDDVIRAALVGAQN